MDPTVRTIVDKLYGPSHQEKMDRVREQVQHIMDDPNWCTASGERAMVPKDLLAKLLANNPDATAR